MATPVPVVPVFAELTEDIQAAVGIADDNAAAHKMLVKLGEGLARINEQWAIVANAAVNAAAAATALRNMEKFIIVEKYPGGSRKRRQSKKRRNHKNHNNNNQ
jgi:hypothetical protein